MNVLYVSQSVKSIYYAIDKKRFIIDTCKTQRTSADSLTNQEL